MGIKDGTIGKTYWKGDLAAYTGNTESLHGGLFYELKILEGHQRHDLVMTSREPKDSFTWDDLANLYDQMNGGRKARTLPLDHVFDWAIDQIKPTTSTQG